MWRRGGSNFVAFGDAKARFELLSPQSVAPQNWNIKFEKITLPGIARQGHQESPQLPPHPSFWQLAPSRFSSPSSKWSCTLRGTRNDDTKRNTSLNRAPVPNAVLKSPLTTFKRNLPPATFHHHSRRSSSARSGGTFRGGIRSLKANFGSPNPCQKTSETKTTRCENKPTNNRKDYKQCEVNGKLHCIRRWIGADRRDHHKCR